MQTTLERSNAKTSTAPAYDKWLAAEVQAALDEPHSGVPHEEVMAKMNKLIEDLTHGKQ